MRIQNILDEQFCFKASIYKAHILIYAIVILIL